MDHDEAAPAIEPFKGRIRGVQLLMLIRFMKNHGLHEMDWERGPLGYGKTLRRGVQPGIVKWLPSSEQSIFLGGAAQLHSI